MDNLPRVYPMLELDHDGFQSDKWCIINTIAGTVSALAALITVLVTAWTLKHARDDKKASERL